jgi:glycosyltransferase involved in cell wall biosynthesis
MKIASSTLIVIPAYQEQDIIYQTITGIRRHGFERIIVVNDGSTDATGEEASRAGATVFHHRLNCGKGAATRTGLEAAKQYQADVIVTMDADGQHDPADIQPLIHPIHAGKTDVVLGVRQPAATTPGLNRLANRIGNALTWFLYGLKVTDSQCGFRAYSHKAIHTINTQGNRYEYDSEVVREIRHHRLSYQEVPIRVHYTPYSRRKPYRQSITNGLKTLYKLIWGVIS